MGTVTAYNARQKGLAMPENLCHWSQNAVIKILERQKYTGCTVNFKTYTESLEFRKRLESPKENWRVFEDTQPAIIEAGQWERVQALRSNKRKMTKIGRTSIFSGLVRCADCGEKLYFCADRNYADGRKDHFVCSNYKSIRPAWLPLRRPGTFLSFPAVRGNAAAQMVCCMPIPPE